MKKEHILSVISHALGIFQTNMIKFILVKFKHVGSRINIKRMDEALPVQGTRGFHCYIPLKSFQVSASPLSGLDSEFSAFDVLPNKSLFSFENPLPSTPPPLPSPDSCRGRISFLLKDEFQDECDRVGSDRPSLFK